MISLRIDVGVLSRLVVFKSPAKTSGLLSDFKSTSNACIYRRRHAGVHLFSKWFATIVARAVGNTMFDANPETIRGQIKKAAMVAAFSVSRK
jgi:hypothetical protein